MSQTRQEYKQSGVLHTAQQHLSNREKNGHELQLVSSRYFALRPFFDSYCAGMLQLNKLTALFLTMTGEYTGTWDKKWNFKAIVDSVVNCQVP
jgi:hypothetical protein